MALYSYAARNHLDLVTRHLKKTSEVKEILARAGKRADGIEFKVISIKEVRAEEKSGATVVIGFSTDDGATNKFDLNIVYIVPTRTTNIPSPLPGRSEIQAATIENIIADKIAACHRFGGGNTRMKDFDDLWQLSSERQWIDWTIVKSLLGENGTPHNLSPDWINDDTSSNWKRHIRRYKDLPKDLSVVISEINRWLKMS